jgi:hypothetical protein
MTCLELGPASRPSPAASYWCATCCIMARNTKSFGSAFAAMHNANTTIPTRRIECCFMRFHCENRIAQA